MSVRLSVLLAILLAAPGTSLAQAGQAPAGAGGSATDRTGEVDFGVRVTGGLGDVGRFQTFGDPTSGPATSLTVPSPPHAAITS